MKFSRNFDNNPRLRTRRSGSTLSMSEEFSIRDELISDLTHHLDSSFKFTLKVGHTSASNKAKIEALRIPLSLKRILQWNWFGKSLQGSQHLYAVDDILKVPDFQRIFNSGFFQIGFCPNGDPICIRFNFDHCPVYYISHDEFLEDEEMDAVEAAVLIFDSLAELLRRMSEGLYIPTDYFSGSEYREHMNEIDNSRH